MLGRRRNLQKVSNPLPMLIVLLAVSFLLAVVDGRGSLSVLANVRQAAFTVFSPMQEAATSFSGPLSGFMSDWAEVGSKNQVITKLQTERDALTRQLATTEDLQRQINAFGALMQTAGLGQYRIVPAKVISIGSSAGFGSTAVIDVGSVDGIKINMTVIAGAGLVGRVISTTKYTSVVILIVDATSTVGARVEASGEIGFLYGIGQQSLLQLEFIDPKAVVIPGQRLVTYGVKGGVFAPGVPLGKVIAIEAEPGTANRLADVEPFADFSSLDLVGVIVLKPRTDPRDSVLPTATTIPTVTVTVTVGAAQTATPSGSPS